VAPPQSRADDVRMTQNAATAEQKKKQKKKKKKENTHAHTAGHTEQDSIAGGLNASYTARKHSFHRIEHAWRQGDEAQRLRSATARAKKNVLRAILIRTSSRRFRASRCSGPELPTTPLPLSTL